MGCSGHRLQKVGVEMRHRFHSLCPYFAMFPESFAQTWIDRLTKPNDIVLDPFAGRGTTAFQALLMGRRAVSCDVNDVAYCLTRAKTDAPSLSALKRRITILQRRFDSAGKQGEELEQPEFFLHAFSVQTLKQLLFLRASLKWKTSSLDAMVASLALGSLHGEMDKSSSYFSNQMPRTISTKPAYSVRYWLANRMIAPERDVFALLRSRAEFRYASPLPEGDAIVLHRDMRELAWLKTALPKPINCCITSPPYFDVTSFEEDQWLRLWLLGGPPFPTRSRISQDDRYSESGKYWSFISDMWRSLGKVLSKNASVVVRIGCRRISPELLVKQLVATGQFSGRKVDLISNEVSIIKNRQTDHFRPGSIGCSVEVDCHLRII
jgi:hypothetical protein